MFGKGQEDLEREEALELKELAGRGKQAQQAGGGAAAACCCCAAACWRRVLPRCCECCVVPAPR